MIKIQDVMRAGHTKRWNIINTTRQQTLAEHLFNVTMITQTLCERCGMPDIFTIAALEWALMHDIPEVVAGDPPSPTKQRMRQMGFDIEKMYDTIDPSYTKAKEAAKEIGADYIVKLADMLEGVKFLSENGVGKHSKKVLSEMSRKMYNHLGSMPPYINYNDAFSVVQDVLDGDTYE